ncbi:type II secretion system protein [Sutcliffiella horikoshii]|uniref:type II secretion system protein n=1 Tax=Sutcliffiella horikoshii TaxID=79883 RepID=UPI00384EB488
MLQKCRKMLRNEKGLTLIELLAVVVILGIIAAIAVPSIGNIIENSRKDAQLANAQQMVNAAKLFLLNDADEVPNDNKIPLSDLKAKNYLDGMKSPHGGSYDDDSSYVKVNDGNVTAVFLETTGSPKHGVYIAGANGAAGTEVGINALDNRDNAH